MAKKGAAKAGKQAGDGDVEAGAKKSGGGFVGLAILAVGAMTSSFATVYVLASDPPTGQAACPVVETGPEVEPIAQKDQTYVELRDILITIGSEPATRYLKMKVAIVTDGTGAGMVEKAEPVLIDAFTNYLRSVELSDFENPDFYAHMREQLSRRSELVLGGGVSQGVLITEFLLR
ncbi:MAG: flagellar basal body-associated FliL family protein [Rhodobacterales bacterium]|jgi:flagellar FliL protein|nr:flagellar basal body-associated FliL family protein [Rhodobacterales bacterium]